MNVTRKLIFLCVCLLLAAVGTFAQNGARYDNIVLDPAGHPIGGVTITVCTSSGTGQPCTPTTSIYQDSALQVPKSNPFNADAYGNYGFWIAPGQYVLTITG